MKVTLLTYTQEPEKTVAAAAKLCYSQKADIADLMSSLDDKEEVNKFLGKLTEMGHESPFEHASFTFAIEGVSRALLAQITRHRIASPSVRSQRYCGEGEFEAVMPATIENNDEARIAFRGLIADTKNVYQKLVDLGIPKEDARMVLPNACETRMIFTMNTRSLWNFFNLRCCSRAQWEIRAVANEMLRLCREAAPALFEKAGAKCDTLGYCPEGPKMTCGRKPLLEERK